MRILLAVAASLLMVAPLVLYGVGALASQDYSSLLRGMGIKVPEPGSAGPAGELLALGGRAVASRLPGSSYVVVDYYPASGGWEKSYVTVPGAPGLPVLVKVITVDGYVPASGVSVGVRVYSFHVSVTHEPVAPVPEPLYYKPGAPGAGGLVYKPDPRIYSSDSFYPGRLVGYSVWHGLGGKTLIVVRFYPVNYDPATGTLVVVDRASVVVSYQSPVPTRAPGRSVLVLTSQRLLAAVQGLVGLYEKLGYNVSIVTVEYINKTYKPAEPPPYPGFANPPYVDPVYVRLTQAYDFNLSLKIIEFLREHAGEYSHLVIVGDAATVPPSYYFAYPIHLMDPYNSWIPTDFFYASPDYDLAPNIYVGRIPFSNPGEVEAYVQKLAAWYNTTAYRSGKLYMSGGYPFLTPEMFGETALATITYRNSTSNFYVELLARTLGNYDNRSVARILAGEAGALWYFAIAHGNGNSLGDLVVSESGGPGVSYRFEVLVNATELLRMHYNPSVPIVSSVACMDAAWDEALVPPSQWFKPPSLGEAVLLSPAGGVAYLGSARIAAELFGPHGLYTVREGTLLADYYGATLLHEEILKAYNELGPRGATLGEVFAQGLASYAAEALTLYQNVSTIGSVIALSEVLKATLLGDPAIVLPRLPTLEPPTARILGVEARGYRLLLNLTEAQTLPMASGSMPVYGVPGNATLAVAAMPGNYSEYTYRIYMSYGDLAGYERIGTGSLTFYTRGNVTLTYPTGRIASGLLLDEFYAEGRGLYRFIYGALGVHVAPESQVAGGLLVVEAYGLDLLNAQRVTLYVAGRPFAADVPVEEGYVNWSAALPYLAPGTYEVTVYPSTGYGYPPIRATQSGPLAALLSATLSVYSRDSISIVVGAPAIVEPGEVEIPIVTLYHGEPLPVPPSGVNATVTGPSGYRAQATLEGGGGSYVLRFKAPEPGVYTVTIAASYENATLKASGYAVVVIDAIGEAYNGLPTLISDYRVAAEKLAAMSGTLNNTLEGVEEANSRLALLQSNVTSILRGVEILGNQTIIIKTKLGDIEGRIVKVEDGVAEVKTSIGTLYLNITRLIQGLNTGLQGLSGKVDNATNSLASLSATAEQAKQKATAAEAASIAAATLAFIAAAVSGLLLTRK